MGCGFRVFTYKLKAEPFLVAVDYFCFKLQGDFRVHEVNDEFTAVFFCKRYGISAVYHGSLEANIQELGMVLYAAVFNFSFACKWDTLKISPFSHAFR